MISAELYVFGTIIYLILGSGEEQSWAKHIIAPKVNDKHGHEIYNEIPSGYSSGVHTDFEKEPKNIKSIQNSSEDEKSGLRDK